MEPTKTANPEAADRRSRQGRKPWVPLVLLGLLVLAVLLIVRGCPRPEREGADGADGDFGPPLGFREVLFVELLYEHSFLPLPEEGAAFDDGGWLPPAGYLWQPLSGQLYASGTEPPGGTALVGEKVRFHHRLWQHSPRQAGALREVGAEGHRWNPSERPLATELPGFDPHCLLRLDLAVAVRFDGENAEVALGEETRELRPGEEAVFAEVRREFTLEEFAAELARLLGELPDERGETGGAVEVDAELLWKHRRVFGIVSGEGGEAEPPPDGSAPVVLRGRLTARHHGLVRLGDRDLAGLWGEGQEALRRRDHDAAGRAFQVLANVLPESQEVHDALLQALYPPEETSGSTALLSGRIEGGGLLLDEEPDFPPYVEAVPEDPDASDASTVYAYLFLPDRYEIRLAPGRYRVRIHLPGHELHEFGIDLRQDSTRDATFPSTP